MKSNRWETEIKDKWLRERNRWLLVGLCFLIAALGFYGVARAGGQLAAGRVSPLAIIGMVMGVAGFLLGSSLGLTYLILLFTGDDNLDY